MTVTPYHIALVRLGYMRISLNPERFTTLFYDRLFEVAPALRPMFKSEMKAQGRKLFDMLTVAISSLETFDHIAPAIRNMGKRHVQYGVEKEHYDLLGNVLLWTLEYVLGEEFTLQVQEAWKAVYTLISETATADAYPERIAF